jgi:hypothetical protein
MAKECSDILFPLLKSSNNLFHFLLQKFTHIRHIVYKTTSWRPGWYPKTSRSSYATGKWEKPMNYLFCRGKGIY